MLSCSPQMFKVLQETTSTSVFLCPEGSLCSAMSREDAVRTLCTFAAEGSTLAAAPLIAAALAREAEENTYIGRGLAVPHARMEGIEHARACLAACPEGLNWGGQPATLVALLIVPADHPELHLRLLSVLAKQLCTSPTPDFVTLAAALKAV